MPRIDDYINARNLAVEKLSQEPFEVILKRSGFESPGADTFRIPFLDRIYRVGFPRFEFEDTIERKKEIPLQEQVLILHYMSATDDTAANRSLDIVPRNPRSRILLRCIYKTGC